MKAKALVADKKQHAPSGSVTFHIAKSFKTLLYVGNDKSFESNKLMLDQAAKIKRPSTNTTNGGRDVVVVVETAGQRSKKPRQQPVSMAVAFGPIFEPEFGIGLPTRQAVKSDKLTLLLLVLLAGCSSSSSSSSGSMTLQFVDAQPQPQPPTPVSLALIGGAPSSASIAAAAKGDLLRPVDGSFNFIDSSCQWKTGSDQVELLVMTLKCDAKPMMRLFENLMPYFNGPAKLRTLDDLFRITYYSDMILNNDRTNEQSSNIIEIWSELLNLDCMIEYFYNEAMHILSRRDFCTYPTIVRLSHLRSFVLGSRLLSYAYDLISINYHSICLIKALNKLPKVPYLVSEVVNIYINGVDKSIRDLNESPTSFANVDSTTGEFKFNVKQALADNGQLKDVTSLILSFPFSTHNDSNKSIEAFKDACKEFLIELDERWQSMEMMSKMLSTEGNGIERFTNYVLRTLVPTKHADVCSQLSAFS